MRYSNRKSTIRINILALTFGTAMFLASSAHAQVGTDGNGTPIFLPNTSSSYNQNGFNLPSMPTITGQDVVRGSGGLSCHSAIGSNGPNFDMGLIGSNDIFNRDSVSVYGRITVPLGKRPKRVDCTKLYDLEIARLKMEIQLMRAGAVPGMFNQNQGQILVTQAPITAPSVIPAATENKTAPSNSDIKTKSQLETETTSKKVTEKPKKTKVETPKKEPIETEIIAMNSYPKKALNTAIKDQSESPLIAPLVIGNVKDVSPTH